MDKPRCPRDDIFSRRPLAEQRSRLDKVQALEEAAVAGREGFMESLVAAAMIISHADGTADLAERRRLVALFRANPVFDGFSLEGLAAEVVEHTRIFSYDRATARERALERIRSATLSASEVRAILAACSAVITADGMTHPAELGALALIRRALDTDASDRPAI